MSAPAWVTPRMALNDVRDDLEAAQVAVGMAWGCRAEPGEMAAHLLDVVTALATMSVHLDTAAEKLPPDEEPDDGGEIRGMAQALASGRPQ